MVVDRPPGGGHTGEADGATPTIETTVTANRRVGVVALALAVAGAPVTLAACPAVPSAVACIVGTHHPSGRNDICVSNATPGVRATLLARARQMAGDNQGTAQRVVAVESADADVNAFVPVHGVSRGEQVEWVVEASGHFRCGTDCFSNSASSNSRNTVLTLDIDPSTLAVTGFELSKEWIDLSKLGTVVVLHP